MGSFGGETRTGYERRSNVEHDHDESKDQRQTEHHAHEHTPEGRRAASLKPAAPRILSQQLGVVDNLFLERTCGPLEAVRIRI